MTEPLCCPGCVAHHLRLVDPDAPAPVHLRRCDSCHGIWATVDAASQVTNHYHQSHYVMAQGIGRRACRKCAAYLPVSVATCRECGHGVTLCCLSCKRPMDAVDVGGVTLDVCRPCRSVWFDRGELGLIAPRHGRELRRQALPAGGVRTQTITSELVLGAGDVGSTLDVVVVAVEVAPRAAGAAIHGLEAAGSVAVEAGAGAAEVAGGVIEVVFDIVTGLFP